MQQRHELWYQGRTSQEVADAIRSAREGAGLTQVELAEKLHSSRSTIVRLENGKNVSFDLILQGLRVLGYQLVAVPFGSIVRVGDDDE